MSGCGCCQQLGWCVTRWLYYLCPCTAVCRIGSKVTLDYNTHSLEWFGVYEGKGVRTAGWVYHLQQRTVPI